MGIERVEIELPMTWGHPRCPACGAEVLGKDPAVRGYICCEHLLAVFAHEVKEYEYTSALAQDLQRRMGFEEPEDDDERFGWCPLSAFLDQLRAASAFCLDVRYVGMACGPRASVQSYVFAFDPEHVATCPPSEDEES